MNQLPICGLAYKQVSLLAVLRIDSNLSSTRATPPTELTS